MTKLEIKTNWTKGEIVSVPRKSYQIKSGLKSHMHFVSSHYVCIREEDAEQCGILVVLHIIRNDQLLIDTLEKSSMHINPNSTFWVRDTARSRLVLKSDIREIEPFRSFPVQNYQKSAIPAIPLRIFHI